LKDEISLYINGITFKQIFKERNKIINNK